MMDLIEQNRQDARLRQEHASLRKTLADLVAKVEDFQYGHLGGEMEAARNILAKTAPKPIQDGGRLFDEAVDRVIARVDKTLNP